MVLEGFSSASYIGFFSAVLPLASPKGVPTLPPPKSIHTLLPLLLYIVMSLIWIDFHLRHLHLLDKENSPVEKFLSLSLFIGASIFDLYFRSCFFLRLKIVTRFLKSLENDVNKIGGSQNLDPKSKKTWKNYKNLISFVSMYHYFGAVLTSLWVAVLLPENTRFLGFIPKSVYPVIFFLFGSVPLVSSFFVAFSFVIVTSIHIGWIFDDFCTYFEEQIQYHETQISNPMKRDLGEIYTITSSSKSKVGSNSDILSKFEHLKLLCAQYDKICGPLLLGLLVRAVFILISSANTILLYNGASIQNGEDHKKLKLVLNIYHFVTELTQLVLLQLGHMMQRRISEKQEDLHRKVILMKNLGPRDQMKEAIAVISDWKWSISGGPCFFEVDRPLLSGVISSLMTYVTILFQMNVVPEDEVRIIVDGITTTESTTISSLVT